MMFSSAWNLPVGISKMRRNTAIQWAV